MKAVTRYKVIQSWDAEQFAKELEEAVNDDWRQEGDMRIVADPASGYRAEICYVQLLSRFER